MFLPPFSNLPTVLELGAILRDFAVWGKFATRRIFVLFRWSDIFVFGLERTHDGIIYRPTKLLGVANQGQSPIELSRLLEDMNAVSTRI
jgi:hypothetical protein